VREVLGIAYVITLPLARGETFGVFKLIAVNIALENKEFLYIDTRIYTIIDKAGLYHCNTTTNESHVCKNFML
jgi:hypothetical protein